MTIQLRIQRETIPLTSDNFELYAARYYTNTRCLSVAEFQSDLARFKYVTRLLRKYVESGVLQERLILNHIIVIYNIFQISAATTMLFHKVPHEYWAPLKTFLVYLNFIPTGEYDHVGVDLDVAAKLKKI